MFSTYLLKVPELATLEQTLLPIHVVIGPQTPLMIASMIHVVTLEQTPLLIVLVIRAQTLVVELGVDQSDLVESVLALGLESMEEQRLEQQMNPTFSSYVQQGNQKYRRKMRLYRL
jgi:hypothetical protein